MDNESIPYAETPSGIKTAKLSKIVKPVTDSLYEVDVSWNSLDWQIESFSKDYGGVDLNPDYQRGHVWTELQQQRFIEASMRKVLPSSAFLIQLNCPNWNENYTKGDLPLGMQCIDGLQRLTAVKGYLAGDVKPFGMHIREFDGSSFMCRGLTGPARFRIAMYGFTKKREVLEHYLAHNTGGTPHSDDELDRVREMLIAAEKPARDFEGER